MGRRKTDGDGSIDWAAPAAIAMTRLGWSPAVFWASTPADLRLALEGLKKTPPAFHQPFHPVDRRELDILRTRFPDR